MGWWVVRARELGRLVTKEWEPLVRLLDEWRSTLNPFLRDTEFPTFVMPVVIPALADVANGDVVLRFTPGFYGRIESAQFYATTPASTAGRSVTFQPRIADLDVTGGAVYLETTNIDVKGDNVEGSTITGRNVFTDTQEITIVASTSAAFAEGAGVIVLTFG
jgi:hypothetical protein